MSAFFFSMAFALVYNVQRVRMARLRLESQMTDASLKSIRTQMKPHFLSNILNSMHYFILSEKPEDAGNFVSSFSRLVRHMLDSSDKNYLPIQPELEQLRDYISFECRRVNRDVKLNIEWQKDADFRNVLIPAMLLQPLVENSLMHGIFPLKDVAGQIDIRIGKVESVLFQESSADKMRVSGVGRLLVRVQDNGQGREASKASRHRRFSQSYGMRGISERLVWIKRKFYVSADMQILDLKDPGGNACGTAVVLNLPLMESTKKNA
jgi:LytS/YehU family sensor histidine kinase